jgi:hypothetical protein
MRGTWSSAAARTGRKRAAEDKRIAAAVQGVLLSKVVVAKARKVLWRR